MLQLTTCLFDPHVMEMISPLYVGASVTLLTDKEFGNQEEMLSLIETSSTTILPMVPSLWNMMTGKYRSALYYRPNSKQSRKYHLEEKLFNPILYVK